MRGTASRIAHAAVTACLLEASAEKPGNVTPTRDFRDMTYTDFLLSGLAVGPVMGQARRYPVGDLVWRAIVATRAVTRVNTNLGIVLLLAPLARAYALHRPADLTGLRESVRAVLADLTVEDARRAYAAIRLAQPGGLGRVTDHDVADEPAVDLRTAMVAAAARDTVAAQYATGYELVFQLGVPALLQAINSGLDARDATVRVFLTFLATVPDTLIARKIGREEAVAVSTRARQVVLAGGGCTTAGYQAQADLDRYLRDPGNRRNPGTTADLIAATLFAALLVHGPDVLTGREAGRRTPVPSRTSTEPREVSPCAP